MTADGEAVLDLLDEAAAAIATAVDALDDRGLAGTKPWQYRTDLAADAAAAEVLDGAGVGVLSEESGLRNADAEVVVVLDPVDGSTNAARGVPWFATSLCAVDAVGPLAALVVNLATGERFDAVRGIGARRNGRPIEPSATSALGESIVGFSGYPPRYLGWRQYRALGALALDLCAVASGVLDGYLDCSPSAHGVWDYLGGALICAEAGATVSDAEGRSLVVLDPDARRTPVAGGTAALHDELLALRTTW